MRPDGAGFLLRAVAEDGQAYQYLWVDWHGEARPIPVGGPYGRGDGLGPWTALQQTRWDGAKAVLVYGRVETVVDTKALRASASFVHPDDAIADGETILSRADLAGGMTVFALRDARGRGTRVVVGRVGDPELTRVVTPVSERLVSFSSSNRRLR